MYLLLHNRMASVKLLFIFRCNKRRNRAYYVLNPYDIKYEGYPKNKFRLRILPLQHCGHNGALACQVC